MGSNFLEELEQKNTCKLFSIPHVTGCNVFLDYLHLKYLGGDMYMFGGLLWLMTFCLLPGQPLSNLEHIWGRMKFWYAKLGVQHRYHYFNRLTMFVRKTGAPKLRGRAVEVLGLNHVMVKIWEETLNPQVEIHRMILQMLKMNNNTFTEMIQLCLQLQQLNLWVLPSRWPT